jgi:hypothetical protein
LIKNYFFLIVLIIATIVGDTNQSTNHSPKITIIYGAYLLSILIIVSSVILKILNTKNIILYPIPNIKPRIPLTIAVPKIINIKVNIIKCILDKIFFIYY